MIDFSLCANSFYGSVTKREIPSKHDAIQVVKKANKFNSAPIEAEKSFLFPSEVDKSFNCFRNHVLKLFWRHVTHFKIDRSF